MTRTVEYRVIPHNVWTIVRFEREDDGVSRAGGSSHCGEFPNEELANKYGAMISQADVGSKFASLSSMNKSKVLPIAPDITPDLGSNGQ